MSLVLALDPGPTQSALLGYDTEKREITFKCIENNDYILSYVIKNGRHSFLYEHLIIEWITSYGLPVGAEVFHTCRWVGRFEEAWGEDLTLMPRGVVKLHLCGTHRAKDANVRAALIEKFGGKETAIGRKASPGPLHGVKSHAWSALGLVITYSETMLSR